MESFDFTLQLDCLGPQRRRSRIGVPGTAREHLTVLEIWQTLAQSVELACQYRHQTIFATQVGTQPGNLLAEQMQFAGFLRALRFRFGASFQELPA
ncbi:hypothetical protein [Candidatus Accumulibacter sp. ACC003]|uniref:hypothetical protein n=1 Tax=Candidatus Accumulibacter sp. ACC003 TaxID=2823334 RepID=UPI0025BA16B1|nr:hypothetical protein [Candidatus Accumulibacter sp. ACC003]